MSNEADPRVLGGIILMQSTLHVMTDLPHLAEFLGAGLRRVPGVRGAWLCVRGRPVETRHADPADIEGCQRQGARCERLWAHDAEPGERPRCTRSSAEGPALPLETAGKRLGYLRLASDDEAELAKYLPYLQNTANLVALVVLNREKTEALTRMHAELEERVDQRTRELRRSEAKYRDLVESLHEGIWQVDAQAETRFVNRHLAGMLGYEVEEMIGRPLFDFMDEEAAAQARQLFERRREGIREQHDFIFRTASGERLVAAVATAALFGEDGSFQGATAALMDVTEQRAEQEQELQSRKLESIGRLAGGIAHDFNNVLTVINANAEMALEDLPPEAPLHRELVDVLQAGEHAAELTRQLLAFSRKQVISPVVLDLGEAVARSLRLIERVLGEDITVVLDTRAPSPQISLDPTQLDQILMNLAANARDAMPDGGELRIEATLEALDAKRSAALNLTTPGPYARLSVADSGRGIPTDVLPHLFEPFFSTRPRDQSTGLGLATVYGIVRQNKGAITVESTPNRGARFDLYFPVDRAAEDTAEKPNAAPRRRASLEDADPTPGPVLVVEDEGSVRRLVERVLARLGYAVYTARDGREALDALARLPKPPSLLITDVVMPRLNGPALVDRVRREYPGLPVLFMSGYSEEVAARRGVQALPETLLRKPFSPQELEAHIQRVLADRHAGG